MKAIEILNKIKQHPLYSPDKKIVIYRGADDPDIIFIGEAPGCVSGDTLIEVAFRDVSKYPHGIPIKELVGKKDFYVYSFDIETGKLVLGKVKKVWETGIKMTYKITYKWKGGLENGKNKWFTNSIIVTSNHKFLLRKINDKKTYFDGINTNTKYEYLSIDMGLKVGHSLMPFDNHIITSIEPYKVIDVYDMEVEKYHNFVANGIIIHNSTENRKGVPFVGRAGKLLSKWIEDLKIKNYGITNIVPLIPLNGYKIRKPTKEEIKYFEFFWKSIVFSKLPKGLVLLGLTAMEGVIGEKKLFQIDNVRLEWENKIMEIPYVGIYHPAYYLYKHINDFSKVYDILRKFLNKINELPF